MTEVDISVIEYQIVGQSEVVINLRKEVYYAAQSDESVLITGKTGTGKTYIAKIIHEQSKRRGKTFMDVNCAEITRNLFESEIFGHKKEAFTGATKNKIGRIKLAEGGTLFLDEIGEFSNDLQAKLLTALEKKEYVPVGGEVKERSDFRLISATNVNIAQQIKIGSFRSDILGRIGVHHINILPLKERKDDIYLLTERFVKIFGKGRKYFISETERKKLHNHGWPLNVRELRNCIQEAIGRCENGNLEFRFLSNELLNVGIESEAPGVSELPAEDKRQPTIPSDDQIPDIKDIIDFVCDHFPKTIRDYKLGEFVCKWFLCHGKNKQLMSQTFRQGGRETGKTPTSVREKIQGGDKLMSALRQAVKSFDVWEEVIKAIKNSPYAHIVSEFNGLSFNSKTNSASRVIDSVRETKLEESESIYEIIALELREDFSEYIQSDAVSKTQRPKSIRHQINNKLREKGIFQKRKQLLDKLSKQKFNNEQVINNIKVIDNILSTGSIRSHIWHFYEKNLFISFFLDRIEHLLFQFDNEKLLLPPKIYKKYQLWFEDLEELLVFLKARASREYVDSYLEITNATVMFNFKYKDPCGMRDLLWVHGKVKYILKACRILEYELWKYENPSWVYIK
jgi:hypothetical protein